MFKFAFAFFFFRPLISFSLLLTSFRFWLDSVRKAFSSTNKFPDFSLTLTISKNFPDFLRSFLTFL